MESLYSAKKIERVEDIKIADKLAQKAIEEQKVMDKEVVLQEAAKKVAQKSVLIQQKEAEQRVTAENIKKDMLHDLKYIYQIHKSLGQEQDI